jgi:hypothetical protein
MVHKIAFFMLLSAATAVSSVQAGQAAKCGNQLFKGKYVMTVDGVVYSAYGPGIHGPVMRVGYMQGNGDGTFSDPSLASYAGVPAAIASPDGWLPEPADGKYTIGPDCSLSLTVNAPPPLGIPITFSGSITSDGRHLSFLQSNPSGTTVKATSEMILTPCFSDDMAGDWSVEMRGTIMPPLDLPLGPPGAPVLNIGLPTVFGDYVMLGLINFSLPTTSKSPWTGEVNGKTTVLYGGLNAAIELGPFPNPAPKSSLHIENWKGTYQLNDDCTVSVRYATSMPGLNTLGAVVGPLNLGWWGILKVDSLDLPRPAVRSLKDNVSKELRFIMSELPIGPMLGKAWPR